MLVSPAKFLEKAHNGNYAVGAFNANNLEVAQGIINGAESVHAPVIVETSQGAIDYATMHALGAMVNALAKDATVPVAFHLDHGHDVDLVKAAIKSGYYTSVMIDASSKPFKENVKITRNIVKLAHKKGIFVEAELGAIPGKEDNIDVLDRDAFFTDIEEAHTFIELTECDSLAISIGTKHGVYKFTNKRVKLDIKRLQEIKKLANIPLVLHGASEIPSNLKKIAEAYGADLSTAHGVTNSALKKAVTNGINKVNIDSDLRIAFTGAVDKYMTLNPNNVDPRKYLDAGRSAVSKAVARKIKVLGSVNKA